VLVVELGFLKGLILKFQIFSSAKSNQNGQQVNI